MYVWCVFVEFIITGGSIELSHPSQNGNCMYSHSVTSFTIDTDSNSTIINRVIINIWCDAFRPSGQRRATTLNGNRRMMMIMMETPKSVAYKQIIHLTINHRVVVVVYQSGWREQLIKDVVWRLMIRADMKRRRRHKVWMSCCCWLGNDAISV